MTAMINCNEFYENARIIEFVENEPRMQFINAVRAYCEAGDPNKKAHLIEAVVRSSRTVTNDFGLLPEELQIGLLSLVERFRSFGPSVVSVPSTYSEARKLIKMFFF